MIEYISRISGHVANVRGIEAQVSTVGSGHIAVLLVGTFQRVANDNHQVQYEAHQCTNNSSLAAHNQTTSSFPEIY